MLYLLNIKIGDCAMKQDKTEHIRRSMVNVINSSVLSTDIDLERKRLSDLYPDVYDTSELSRSFEVIGFMAPFAVVQHRETGKKGSIEFQDRPRLYFNFQAD